MHRNAVANLRKDTDYFWAPKKYTKNISRVSRVPHKKKENVFPLFALSCNNLASLFQGEGAGFGRRKGEGGSIQGQNLGREKMKGG